MDVATQMPNSVAGQKPIPAPIKSAAGDTPSLSYEELKFELGLWFSGLESFLAVGIHSFAHKDHPKPVHDWSKEVRLTHSTLLLCSQLNFLLLKRIEEGEQPEDDAASIKSEYLRKIQNALKDAILLNESLISAEPLKFGVWKAWSNVLLEKLKANHAFENLIETAERSAEDFVPERLKDILADNKMAFAERVDLNQVLPRFAKILKWLSIVGKMLKRDEPLKPALLIFSRVYEQTRELIDHINNRLQRFPDEESNLFNSLDGASYTASLELRKVYEQELSGIVSIRPSLSIYARVETAYSLLNDSFQQILTDLARLADPSTEVHDLFPDFLTKLEQSLLVRKELWQLLQIVRRAEKDPNDLHIKALELRMGDFLGDAVNYLFYKDKESVERFAEEIFVTVDKQDLTGILHRFGTYIETLFGQVNIRAVLADHPFDPEKN